LKLFKPKIAANTQIVSNKIEMDRLLRNKSGDRLDSWLLGCEGFFAIQRYFFILKELCRKWNKATALITAP